MNTDFLLAFSVGLLSAVHCVGMCGGIVGALSFSLPEPVRRTRGRLLLYLLAYNLGRTLSYALAGALFGSLGALLIAGGEHGAVHRVLLWVAAIVTIGIGLYIAGLFPRFIQIERIGEPLWRYLEPFGRRLLPVSSLSRAMIYGAIWGWLPCGLVYSMLIATPARDGAVTGALFMALFGLGTLPTMLVIGLFTGRLLHLAKDPRLRLVGGLSVIILGLFTLYFQGYTVDIKV